MALYKTQALVLRSIQLADADKIVTFFSPTHGKIKCVAKAVRKIKSRFGGTLQPLSHIQLIYFGKENQDLFRLSHCEIIQSFQSIRETLGQLYTGLYFCELIDTLLKEGDPHQDIFFFMIESLRALQQNANPESLCRLVELRLMRMLGYAPNLTHCSGCQAPPQTELLGFSYHQGGIVCGNCLARVRPEVRFNTGTLNYLKKLLTLDLEFLARLKIPKSLEVELETMTHRLILSHVGRELKSYPFIKSMAV